MCKLPKWWRHKLNRILINYDEKNISQPICIRSDWFFAEGFYYVCSTRRVYQLCSHGNILGSRRPWYQKLSWPPFALYFDICQWSLMRKVQQAYKYVRSSFWPFKMFVEHKIIKNKWNQIWETGKEWVDFHSGGCVACRTFTPPSFRGLYLKINRDSSTCIIDVTLSWVNGVISCLNCIFCRHFKLKYLRNQCR